MAYRPYWMEEDEPRTDEYQEFEGHGMTLTPAEQADNDRLRARSLRQSARLKVAHFEKWVRMHEMRGMHHPDIRDWIEQCYQIAKLRMQAEIDYTMDVGKLKMPKRPEIDYDR